jgi:hypothetical protein
VDGTLRWLRREWRLSMGKNGFLEKQKATQRAYFDAGLQSGRQQILDMMSLVLRDSEIMGKDTFGKDRLLKVVKGISEYIDKYQPAWERSDDADYYQKNLDDALAEAYGDGLADTFYKRYEFMPEFNYNTGRWGK